MLQISIREFQLRAGEYLERLPIILTRYNVPVAKLVKYEEEDVGETHGAVRSVDTVAGSVDTTKFCMLCRGRHPGVSVGLFHISEGDGEGAEVDGEVELCQWHLDEIKTNKHGNIKDYYEVK